MQSTRHTLTLTYPFDFFRVHLHQASLANFLHLPNSGTYHLEEVSFNVFNLVLFHSLK